MKKDRFPQELLHTANSLIALKRQGGHLDPRLEKRKAQLSEQLMSHPDEMRERVAGYITSESRVTAGGGSDIGNYRRW